MPFHPNLCRVRLPVRGSMFKDCATGRSGRAARWFPALKEKCMARRTRATTISATNALYFTVCAISKSTVTFKLGGLCYRSWHQSFRRQGSTSVCQGDSEHPREAGGPYGGVFNSLMTDRL